MGQPAGRHICPVKSVRYPFCFLFVLSKSKFALCPLQKMSHGRLNQLRELQSIIEEISRAIMWVNEREEEELVFDWGDKNIDQYIPRKQENYSVRISRFNFFFFKSAA